MFCFSLFTFDFLFCRRAWNVPQTVCWLALALEWQQGETVQTGLLFFSQRKRRSLVSDRRRQSWIKLFWREISPFGLKQIALNKSLLTYSHSAHTLFALWMIESQPLFTSCSLRTLAHHRPRGSSTHYTAEKLTNLFESLREPFHRRWDTKQPHIYS